MMAFFDLNSKINVIHPTLTKELKLSIKSMDVKSQKINRTMLNTYGMIIAAFLVINKANRVKFFEETLLVANISPKVIFKMLFLILSNANVDFFDQEI